jgi:hypothetical protein
MATVTPPRIPADTVGYSGKPLWQKLGYKPGTRVLLCSPPANYRDLLGIEPPEWCLAQSLAEPCDLIHAFFTEHSALEQWLWDYRKSPALGVPVWISWPKKIARVATNITEDTIREVALPLGMVDTKVCAVSDIWSGLRLNKRVKQ